MSIISTLLLISFLLYYWYHFCYFIVIAVDRRTSVTVSLLTANFAKSSSYPGFYFHFCLFQPNLFELLFHRSLWTMFFFRCWDFVPFRTAPLDTPQVLLHCFFVHTNRLLRWMIQVVSLYLLRPWSPTWMQGLSISFAFELSTAEDLVECFQCSNLSIIPRNPPYACKDMLIVVFFIQAGLLHTSGWLQMIPACPRLQFCK